MELIMKKLILATTLVLGFTLMFAEEGPAKKGHKGPKGKVNKEQILKEFDKDKDGKLSEDERSAAREAMKDKFEARKRKRRV